MASMGSCFVGERVVRGAEERFPVFRLTYSRSLAIPWPPRPHTTSGVASPVLAPSDRPSAMVCCIACAQSSVRVPWSRAGSPPPKKALSSAAGSEATAEPEGGPDRLPPVVAVAAAAVAWGGVYTTVFIQSYTSRLPINDASHSLFPLYSPLLQLTTSNMKPMTSLVSASASSSLLPRKSPLFSFIRPRWRRLAVSVTRFLDGFPPAGHVPLRVQIISAHDPLCWRRRGKSPATGFSFWS